MTLAPQSSPAFRLLPACAALLLAVAAPLAAQTRQQVRAATVHRAPNGTELARTTRQASWTVARQRNGWAEFRLDGWVATSLLRRQQRDGFDLVVAADDVRLRAEPDGRELARLEEGMLLTRVDTRGTWTRVRRQVWVPTRAIVRATAAADTADTTAQAYRTAPAPTPLAPTLSQAERDSASAERVELVRAAPLRTAPDGGELGSVAEGAPARVVGRAGDWARVQVEGWVRAEDLKSSSGALVGVTAAEVRANPERYVGQTVEWRLQYLSHATADELRPEMPPGQPYLLARGPLPETGFVYLMVSRDDAARLRGIAALTELTVHARVRAARTRFLTTPVVELVSLVSPTLAGR